MKISNMSPNEMYGSNAITLDIMSVLVSSFPDHSLKQLLLNNSDIFNLLESLLKSPKDSSEKLLDSTSDLTQVNTVFNLILVAKKRFITG